MKTIEAIIERALDGSYSVYCKDEIFSGHGDTIEAAKQDMLEQMKFYKETALEEGFKYPPFLDGEYDLSYRVDATSLLKYYVEAGYFTLAGMQKLTGINQKQLWSYIKGSKPRQAQRDRIERGFRYIEKDLSTFFFG
ncbi:MAG: type II toxin-antitoxin system HicB family antitoxin [Bacteroidales bacterium]|nr:type II toxin-antitoxin system HicB family antitoxin [Bacteroidales bacterium]